MRLGNHIVYDLLESAEYLLDKRSGRANLMKVLRRRAISSAYYAVFQAICFVVADETVGWSSDPGILDPVFRTPDHRQVKERLSKSGVAVLKRLGVGLSELQDRRHDADYSPPRYSPSHPDVLALLQQAREAVQLIEDLSPEQRRLLAVMLLAKPR